MTLNPAWGLQLPSEASSEYECINLSKEMYDVKTIYESGIKNGFTPFDDLASLGQYLNWDTPSNPEDAYNALQESYYAYEQLPAAMKEKFGNDIGTFWEALEAGDPQPFIDAGLLIDPSLTPDEDAAAATQKAEAATPS